MGEHDRSLDDSAIQLGRAHGICRCNRVPLNDDQRSSRRRWILKRPDQRRRFSCLVFLPVLCWTFIFPANRIGADDQPINQRLLQRLLGRHDRARLAAMMSIGTDYQSRIEALPTVLKGLEQLKDDARFTRPPKPGVPELPDGILQMIQFAGGLDRPESTDTLCDLLSMQRITWVLASAQTLGHNRHHSAIDSINSLVDSDFFEENYGFRFTVARALTEMNHPDAWEALANIALHVDGQLAYLLEQEFQEVSVDAFLGEQKRFQAWRDSLGFNSKTDSKDASSLAPSGGNALAEAARILSGKPAKESGPTSTPEMAGDLPLPEKMSLSSGQSAVSYLREKRLHPSHYYGIEIYAKRLLFVLDRSGSMDTMIYGQSRMQRAKRELIAAIQGLDPECEFGIIVFDSSVRAWRNDLVKAEEQTKREAIQYVSNLACGNRTNTYAALRQSLEFNPQVEAVFLLTDGQPTTGQLVNPSAILLDVLRRNQVHNITINTVAIAVEPVMETFLRRLTEPSQGECRVVD